MKVKNSTFILEHFPIFQSLTEAELSLLQEMAEKHVVSKYSFIYFPNEPSEHIYFLSKGSIKIGTHSEDGKEVIKSVLHPLAMFGELAIIGEERRQDFAQAMNNEVHYLSLKVADFKRLMQTNFDLCSQVLAMMGTRLMKAENRLEGLIFKDARTRIVDFIKEYAENRGRQVGYERLFKHSLTQQDIANLTGTSRQTVTSVLNDLRKSNLIYFNRNSILIRDMAKLV
ncbi:MAG: Crp/Fnr family transcriptional regulator [Bacteroidota bacterium]